MLNITSEEINSLERIGSGSFGTVYFKDNKAYKIYHEMIKIDSYIIEKNPSLKLREIKIKRLLERSKKLKYTDLIEDIIYVDGKFGGIVMPYYDGETLLNTKDKPLKEKIDISKKLVRNAKELTKHRIYSLDYSLRNIMLVDNEVKIIDLDDYNTEVTMLPSLAHKRSVVLSLDDTIKSYFNDSFEAPLNYQTQKKLGKKISLANSEFKEVDAYLEEKSKPYNYILINENAAIWNNIDLLRNPKYRVIYIYDGWEYENLDYVINDIFEKGFKLYDTISESQILDYTNNTNYIELLDIRENRVLVKSK